MEPSKIDETYQITLDCLMNRSAYKKYVKNTESSTNDKQAKLYESLKTSRALLCMKFQNLIKTPSDNLKIQHVFEQFVEALLQEKEELESKEGEAEEEEEEETLFAHIPEHSPTEIEYWKMQQVFKIPPS